MTTYFKAMNAAFRPGLGTQGGIPVGNGIIMKGGVQTLDLAGVAHLASEPLVYPAQQQVLVGSSMSGVIVHALSSTPLATPPPAQAAAQVQVAVQGQAAVQGQVSAHEQPANPVAGSDDMDEDMPPLMDVAQNLIDTLQRMFPQAAMEPGLLQQVLGAHGLHPDGTDLAPIDMLRLMLTDMGYTEVPPGSFALADALIHDSDDGSYDDGDDDDDESDDDVMIVEAPPPRELVYVPDIECQRACCTNLELRAGPKDIVTQSLWAASMHAYSPNCGCGAVVSAESLNGMMNSGRTVACPACRSQAPFMRNRIAEEWALEVRVTCEACGEQVPRGDLHSGAHVCLAMTPPSVVATAPPAAANSGGGRGGGDDDDDDADGGGGGGGGNTDYDYY